MATDHRGKDVHAGKRTDDELHVSRLATLMANQKNNRGMTGATPEGVQGNLDAYRIQRDDDSLSIHKLEASQKNISESFKNRHNKDYQYGDGYGQLK